MLAGLLFLASPAPADDAELHRWIDGEGVVRYSPDRSSIPFAHRSSAQRVQEGMELPAPPSAPESPAAAAPAASTFPSVIGAPVPDPSLSLRDTGLPAPGPTAVADASPSDPPAAAEEPEEKDLGTQIRELEAAIARDEETLKDMISTPPAEGEEGIESSAELRAIARRLPGMQAELRALRQRQAIEGP